MKFLETHTHIFLEHEGRKGWERLRWVCGVIVVHHRSSHRSSFLPLSILLQLMPYYLRWRKEHMRETVAVSGRERERERRRLSSARCCHCASSWVLCLSPFSSSYYFLFPFHSSAGRERIEHTRMGNWEGVMLCIFLHKPPPPAALSAWSGQFTAGEQPQRQSLRRESSTRL